MKIKIKKLHPNATTPKYATAGAACFDLHASDVNGKFEVGSIIDHNQPVICGNGLSFEIPKDHVMLVFGRSGHAFKNDIRLANCVGVIDSDYRGEIVVKLTKDCDDDEQTPPEIIRPGDRIAQALILPVEQVQFEVTEELSETDRGQGGFGSTGA
jgi:dUTP pyrophosphatase